MVLSNKGSRGKSKEIYVKFQYRDERFISTLNKENDYTIICEERINSKKCWNVFCDPVIIDKAREKI